MSSPDEEPPNMNDEQKKKEQRHCRDICVAWCLLCTCGIFCCGFCCNKDLPML